MRALITVIALTFVALLGPRAHAQPADVPGLIKLIDNQPSDMDRSTWKEKRRDAARKLGQSKDKRATPLLIRLADTETFDIIGDIAIEGLGYLGDQSAVPTLQHVLADTSRDKSSRDLAKKSLAKLGAPEKGAGTTGGATTGGGTTTTTTTTTTGGGASTGSGTGSGSGSTTAGGTTTTTTTGGGSKTGGGTHTGGGAKTGGGSGGSSGGATSGGSSGGAATTSGGGGTGSSTGGATGGGGSTTVATGGSEGGGDTGGGDLGGSAGAGLLGEKTSTTVEGMPELEDDVIAASERLTFAAGTSSLQIQTTPADTNGTKPTRVDFDADVAAYYQRHMDTESKAYAIDGDTHLIAGFINPAGRGQSRGVLFDTHLAGEARFYSNKLYGIGKAAGALSIQYTGYTDANDPANDLKDTTFAADLQLALGGGFGRVVDVGSAIRVRRLSHLLDEARALGKPIDAATSKKLQLTWWALRKERSPFRSLIATIAVLREAGILLGEPNAVITYEILSVLEDTNLFLRPSGFDAQLVVGEGYLKRPTDMAGNCTSTCGRLEQVIASAGYGAQLDDDKLELSGNGYARYRLFAADGDPTPWALGALGRMRRFTYGEHGDPFGVFDVSAELMASSNGSADPNNPSDKSLRIQGELGFTYIINQASGVRVAAQAAEDAGVIYLGATLQGTYGLLDGTFAR